VAFELSRQDETSPTEWWFEVEQPLFMNVELYALQTDGRLVRIPGRLSPALRHHAFDYRVPVFGLQLTDLRPTTYFLRVVTQTSMSAALTVWQPEAFVKHHANVRFFWGGVYGACLLIILFYGVWSLWTWDRLHFVYMLYVLTNLMASIFSAAWPRQFFPGLSEESFLVWAGLWISLAVPMSAFFTFEILKFRQESRWIPLAVKGLSVFFFLISMALILSGRYSTAMPMIQFYALNLILLSAGLAAWRSIKGDRSAQFFLMAFGVFYIGVAWRFLKNIGWVEPNFWSTNAYQIGTFLHMLIMSVSVFAAYSRLRKDKQQAEYRLETESRLRQEQATFLGMVSHEFRTPLSIIASTGDNLLAEPGLSDQARTRVEKIIRANKRLSALMEEYLSYERLVTDSTNQVHETFDLSQVARRLVVDASDHDGPAVQLEAKESVMVLGDPELMRVALHNLIVNARSHSPEQGVVTVRVEHQAQEVVVTVADQGPGIEPSERGKIFDKFFRGRNALSKPGAGMGLFLVKSIVEQHQGVVQQRNLDPQGCEFVVRLPAR
jgi:signal transduction histidine kinase